MHLEPYPLPPGPFRQSDRRHFNNAPYLFRTDSCNRRHLVLRLLGYLHHCGGRIWKLLSNHFRRRGKLPYAPRYFGGNSAIGQELNGKQRNLYCSIRSCSDIDCGTALCSHSSLHLDLILTTLFHAHSSLQTNNKSLALSIQSALTL